MHAFPPPESPRSFWLRWVFANTWSELVGLGGTAAVAVALHRFWAGGPAPGRAILSALIVLASGALLEGGLVGVAQWKVLQYQLPLLPALPWVRSTIAGAALAWALGLIPIMAAQLTQPAAAAAPAPHGGAVLALALAMGFLLGPILAIPQAFVLRGYVSGAGWWIPANALAWALGMVVIFAGASSIPAGLGVWALAGWIGGTCLVAGLVVGGVHGAAMVWLLGSGKRETGRGETVGYDVGPGA